MIKVKTDGEMFCFYPLLKTNDISTVRYELKQINSNCGNKYCTKSLLKISNQNHNGGLPGLLTKCGKKSETLATFNEILLVHSACKSLFNS